MKEQKEPRQYEFISHLEKLHEAKDRAALAKLRRGLGKKMGTPEMYRYVVPFLPSESTRIEREHHFLLASLFALHPTRSSRGVTLGAIFRRIWDGRDSIEKRFTNLLSADPEDISGHLRHAISLAKSSNVPIDYHQLFYDLKHWNHRARFVQLSWARDFWGTEKQSVTDSSSKGENA